MLKSILKYFNQGGAAFVFLCLALLINHRTGYISVVGIFMMVYGFTMLLKTKLDRKSLAIVAYCVLYLIFSSINGVPYQLHALALYGICPIVFYQYGKDIAKRWDSENKHMIFWIIIVFCYCVDIFLICGHNILSTGELINLRREFSFDKTDAESVSATLIGLSMDIGMIGLPMSLIVKDKKVKLAFFILFLGSLIVTLHLLNRTGLVVMVLCAVSLVLFRSRKDRKLLLISIAAILCLALALWYFDVLNKDLIEYYTARNKDLSTMGDRTGRWASAVSNLLVHPFGWINYENHIRTFYVHNMWLDVARVSGILPFILLVYLGCSSFISSFGYVRKTESQLSYLILALNICFFASCFVEPILGGTHFMLYCLLWGYQETVISQPRVSNVALLTSDN